MHEPNEDFEIVEQSQAGLRDSIEVAGRLVSDAEMLLQRSRQAAGAPVQTEGSRPAETA